MREIPAAAAYTITMNDGSTSMTSAATSLITTRLTLNTACSDIAGKGFDLDDWEAVYRFACAYVARQAVNGRGDHHVAGCEFLHQRGKLRQVGRGDSVYRINLP